MTIRFDRAAVGSSAKVLRHKGFAWWAAAAGHENDAAGVPLMVGLPSVRCIMSAIFASLMQGESRRSLAGI